MFIKRLATALVGIPILLSLIYLAPAWAVALLLGTAGLLALIEYLRMVFPADTGATATGALFGGLLFAGWAIPLLLGDSSADFLYPTVPTVVFLLGFLYFLFRPLPMETVAPRVALFTFGLVYIGVTSIHLLALYALPGHGADYLLLLFVITWLNDTGGYLFGKTMGRHKLYPAVSPNKTWEGSVGGALLGIGGALLVGQIRDLPVPALHLVVAALLAGAVGQTGDLCESLIKRSTGVKDSGALLPGHGGMLDRVDALLFGAPVLYLYLVRVLPLA